MDKKWSLIIYLCCAIAAGWGLFELVSRFLVEQFWFAELGYRSVFLKQVSLRIGLWSLGFCGSFVFLWINYRVVDRQEWQIIPDQSGGDRQTNVPRPPLQWWQKFFLEPIPYHKKIPESPAINFRGLLLLMAGFSLLIVLILFHYGSVVWEMGQRDMSLPLITPALPDPLAFKSLRSLWQFTQQQIWRLGLAAVVLGGILWQRWFSLRAIAVVLSLCFGTILANNWVRIFQGWFGVPFSQIDPIYNHDAGFYVFTLPLWQILDFWFEGLFLYGLVSVTLYYLLSGDSFSQGQFPGFSPAQLRHLNLLAGLLFLAVAGRHWLVRYELLYSKLGVVYGVSYTNINVDQHVEILLTVLALAIAAWCLGQFWRYPHRRTVSIRRQQPQVLKGIILYIGVMAIGAILSAGTQRLIVQPNELARERPYLEYSIASTRRAFGLDAIESRVFNPEGELTASDIDSNPLTINNIRLWDSRPILQTNRQLQQIRLYYRFSDADIDRYTLRLNPDQNPSQQQVIIAPRELDYEAVPEQAKTWVNKHLIYTHGYGFTVSPVNRAEETGLPQYYVQDIGAGATADNGNLTTLTPAVREAIPIGQPRIYYGELTNNYVMTDTKVQELDYPSGEDNRYNTYDGTGGIAFGNPLKRLFFAQYLRDWRILLSNDLTGDTRLLMRRNINQRVRAIAPFLRFDRDPYLVSADIGETNRLGEKNYLYWILDAYTTSDHYPYADPGEHPFNYIRNSVKVVINAYNGTVRFYIADAADPMIQTWARAFPELFRSFAELPDGLKEHLRYPTDLFNVQSERLLSYHMQDPQVFYNREDQWEIPQEVYGNEPQEIAPYYLIMRLPTATSEEFILLHPYTPTSRPNLIAWLAGRADGEHYGKLLLYQFPKQKLIYGPDQIEALIKQDPVISQQISLWNREGSRAVQGKLLVIPIEQSLLYVEPLYLEAEENSVPTLARVIVVYNNQIVMSRTLETALNTIFRPEQVAPQEETIFRDLETDVVVPPPV
ncbi:UPF0182 family protein [Picosynechococcus sp. PCC 11901]|uniref:UPF0182 family protein n=1 Tax=Picosynechococcus sp. PCC 11901 TaxID=2579791 RepID=UPI0010FBEDCC|nr:UPF0182 family protein [Picosynechococcus sp. PCC 11901]QCS48725.1 UPF0182 family protein [Picosynechococcus sp. PCC 11901]